jgi:4-amino-4-deoxy-L-arabinose transferase-like glycosyltransferase
VSHLNSQAPGRQLTRNQIGAVVALALILALGMCLRFQELRSVPGWASDEGSNIDIANRLAQGRLGYLAIGRSSFINGHPHFFYLILAGLYRLADFDLVWARGLTAVYGMVTMVLLYLVTDRMFNRATALLAALIFAVYPRAVLYNRMAFTYNQLQPLYVMALYLLWRYLESGGRRWLVYASLCVGAALVTDLTATSLLLVLLLLVLGRRPKHVLWAVRLLGAWPCGAWGDTLSSMTWPLPSRGQGETPWSRLSVWCCWTRPLWRVMSGCLPGRWGCSLFGNGGRGFWRWRFSLARCC